MPLVVGGEATGRISLQNLDREHAFSEADVRLLTTLAGSLSVALENARLFDETRQRNAELALINDVQRGLAESLDMQAMYDLVGDRIQEIFDAQVVDIAHPRRERRADPLPVRDRAGRRASTTTPIELIGFRRHAARDARAAASSTRRRQERPTSSAIGGAVRARCRSRRVFVPLVVGDEATGVISLQNLDRSTRSATPTSGC